jgi:proteasome-associated ATPase
VARSDDAETRAARWEKEAHDLSTQVAFLQEELALVRRKLTESPRHVRQLEERLAATSAQLARLTENNERLVATLKEARAQIVTLKEEIDRLAQPPSGYGVFLGRHEDGTVDVFTGGR